MRIRVVDLETTGFEPPAAVCEIGWSDLTLSDSGYAVGLPEQVFVDPGHPIPPETSAVHHIVDDDVKGARPWNVAGAIALVSPDDIATETPGLVAFAAHNARFEKQWCAAFTGVTPWICTYKAALRLFPDAPAHNNGTLRYWLMPPGLARDVALLSHRAGPDAYVTAFLLRELLSRASLDDLIRWSAEPALLVRCTFGKHRGSLWRDVPTDYLRWCSGQQMDEDVAFTVRHELRRREASR